MSLSCSCEYDDPEWWYSADEDFTRLSTKRGRKCCSCGTSIHVGEDVLRFYRWRAPNCDIEERIYGDGGEITIATWFMCEKCGGLYMAIDDLHFCCDISEDMAAQIKEYMLDGEGGVE